MSFPSLSSAPRALAVVGTLLGLGCGGASDPARDVLDDDASEAAALVTQAANPDAEADATTGGGPTLPKIDDPAQPGPFRAEVVATAPGLSSHSLFVPSNLGRDGIKHPIVVWTNGNGGSTSFYRAFLEHLATHGFFVVADKRSTSNHALENGEQIKGIDWAVAQAASGPYAGKLDVKALSIMGHSLGSLASFANGGDPRVATTIHWSGGLTGNPVGADESVLSKLHAPAAFLCGGADTMAGPACAKDFDKAPKNLPVFYGTLAGASHLGVFGNRNGGEYGRMGVAWLRLHLAKDESFRSWFSGPSCKACVRPWTGKSRNLDQPKP